MNPSGGRPTGWAVKGLSNMVSRPPYITEYWQAPGVYSAGNQSPVGRERMKDWFKDPYQGFQLKIIRLDFSCEFGRGGYAWLVIPCRDETAV